MTQQQALEQLMEMNPGKRAEVYQERWLRNHATRPAMNHYWLYLDGEMVADSGRSWEHAIAIAKSGDENCWPESDGLWEDEQVSAA